MLVLIEELVPKVMVWNFSASSHDVPTPVLIWYATNPQASLPPAFGVIVRVPEGAIALVMKALFALNSVDESKTSACHVLAVPEFVTVTEVETGVAAEYPTTEIKVPAPAPDVRVITQLVAKVSEHDPSLAAVVGVAEFEVLPIIGRPDCACAKADAQKAKRTMRAFLISPLSNSASRQTALCLRRCYCRL